MSTSEAGRRGGSTVRDKYGEDYYRRIGKKGGTALKEKRGSDYYRSIAQKGGQANVSKYGPDHFAEMGKKGGNTTKERQDSDFYSRIGKLGGAAKRQKKRRLSEAGRRESILACLLRLDAGTQLCQVFGNGSGDSGFSRLPRHAQGILDSLRVRASVRHNGRALDAQ